MRDLPVLPAGGGVSAGVVVHEHDCRRALRDRVGKYLPRMNEAPVQDADRHATAPQHAVLDVEQHHKEHLDGGAGEEVSILLENIGRRPHRFAPRDRGGQRATGKFENRFPLLPQGALDGFLSRGGLSHRLPTLRKCDAEQGRLVHFLERTSGEAHPSPHFPPVSDDARKAIQIPFQKFRKVRKTLSDNTGMDSREALTLVSRLRSNIEIVLLGKSREVELALASFLAGGHILLEDIPGTGKTTLARAISASISGTFRRIQFTSDLLPQDVVGVHILDGAKTGFTFSPGPLFANIVLADEINRSNPRAQSALLEAMSERQVSVDTKTYPLPDPFLVIATQNPFELHGTYPLPESQLDRFNLRLRLNYPDRESELRLIRENTLAGTRDGLHPVIVPEQIRRIRTLVEQVTVRDSIVAYIYRIVEATRRHPSVRLGASPRGAIGVKSTSQALAFLSGRDFVTPGDVRKTVTAVLCHRIFLAGEAPETEAGEAILSEILEAVPAPV